jgi:hypothetical protein
MIISAASRLLVAAALTTNVGGASAGPVTLRNRATMLRSEACSWLSSRSRTDGSKLLASACSAADCSVTPFTPPLCCAAGCGRGGRVRSRRVDDARFAPVELGGTAGSAVIEAPRRPGAVTVRRTDANRLARSDQIKRPPAKLRAYPDTRNRGGTAVDVHSSISVSRLNLAQQGDDGWWDPPSFALTHLEQRPRLCCGDRLREIAQSCGAARLRDSRR